MEPTMPLDQRLTSPFPLSPPQVTSITSTSLCLLVSCATSVYSAAFLGCGAVYLLFMLASGFVLQAGKWRISPSLSRVLLSLNPSSLPPFLPPSLSPSLPFFLPPSLSPSLPFSLPPSFLPTQPRSRPRPDQIPNYLAPFKYLSFYRYCLQNLLSLDLKGRVFDCYTPEQLAVSGKVMEKEKDPGDGAQGTGTGRKRRSLSSGERVP